MVHVIDRKKPELASDFRKLAQLESLERFIGAFTNEILVTALPRICQGIKIFDSAKWLFRPYRLWQWVNSRVSFWHPELITNHNVNDDIPPRASSRNFCREIWHTHMIIRRTVQDQQRILYRVLLFFRLTLSILTVFLSLKMHFLDQISHSHTRTFGLGSSLSVFDTRVDNNLINWMRRKRVSKGQRD